LRRKLFLFVPIHTS